MLNYLRSHSFRVNPFWVTFHPVIPPRLQLTSINKQINNINTSPPSRQITIMASLLSSHLESISNSASSISSLSFPGPSRFTNALLYTRDITSLIRDTEQHERALFHLAPPSLPANPTLSDSLSLPPHVFASAPGVSTQANRRATVYGTRQPKNKAVAAVLGGDLYRKTRREEGTAREKGDVDVEVLLAGAEKLAAV